MREQILDEVVARRYWLGQLSPEEQGRIEELAFGDPQSFALLEAVEDDLIDEFVYNDLSAEERDRFQEYFLTQPGRSEDLRIAQALRQHLDQEFPAPSLWQQFRKFFHLSGNNLIPAVATGAATIVAIIIIAIILRDRIRRPPSQPFQAENQSTPALPTPTSTPSETPAHTSPSPTPQNDQNKTPVPRDAPPAYGILLSPGTPVRGGGEVTAVPKKPGTVELRLPLTGNPSYRRYEASLERENGESIQTWTVKPTRIISGNIVRVSVPFSRLEVSQRYRIVLKGIAANGNSQPYEKYYFVVTNYDRN